MWRVYLSCRINQHLFGGDPGEMLCARAYRESWWSVCIYNIICFWHWGQNHCRICFEYHLDHGHYREERTMEYEQEPMLPLDERFRVSEQYALDLPEPRTIQAQPARPQVEICIGNCDICRRCGNTSNRD